MTNTLAQDLGGVEAFCDAMEREHGYRPKLLPNGILLHGRDADRYEGWELAVHSAEIAGALRDAERLDWMASGEQKMLQRSIDGQWFRVYRDVAAQDAEHAEWSAMTEAHFTTARAAIDSAMQQGGGGGDHG